MINALRRWVSWMCCGLVCSASAQLAPGEDPVQLEKPVHVAMLPLPAQMTTAPATNQDMPAWLDAKLARLQAKAFSSDTRGILTDEDVVNSTVQNGLRTVCTQEIGSNTASNAESLNRFGQKSDVQMVVLRGDLVNICR